MAVSAASSSSSRVSAASSSARGSSAPSKSNSSTTKASTSTSTSTKAKTDALATQTADRFEKAARQATDQKVALQPVRAASALLMNALVLGTPGVSNTMTMGDPVNPTRPYSGSAPTLVLKKGI